MTDRGGSRSTFPQAVVERRGQVRDRAPGPSAGATAEADHRSVCYHLQMGQIGTDLEQPDAVPYFNWDAPVTNARVRQILVDGSENDKVFWVAKIMREARYEDVWKYVSLRRDVLPRWPKIEPHLGRWKDKWRFLIEGWQQRGLL
jgi:hypothetical protein